jgi:hypothetical protein
MNCAVCIKGKKVCVHSNHHMAPSVNYKICEPVSKYVSLFEQYLQQFTTPVFTLSGTNEQIAKQIQEFANKVRIGA